MSGQDGGGGYMHRSQAWSFYSQELSHDGGTVRIQDVGKFSFKGTLLFFFLLYVYYMYYNSWFYKFLE